MAMIERSNVERRVSMGGEATREMQWRPVGTGRGTGEHGTSSEDCQLKVSHTPNVLRARDVSFVEIFVFISQN